MMISKESIECFMDGLSTAAARARELGALQNVHLWGKIADTLDSLREKGEFFIKSSPMSNSEVVDELRKCMLKNGGADVRPN